MEEGLGFRGSYFEDSAYKNTQYLMKNFKFKFLKENSILISIETKFQKEQEP